VCAFMCIEMWYDDGAKRHGKLTAGQSVTHDSVCVHNDQ